MAHNKLLTMENLRKKRHPRPLKLCPLQRGKRDFASYIYLMQHHETWIVISNKGAPSRGKSPKGFD
jgi:hypothetical protein